MKPEQSLVERLRSLADWLEEGDWSPSHIETVRTAVAHIQEKAYLKFETVDDLIAWLDTLHAKEGDAITNRKWEPAQRAIAALRGSP